MEEEALHGQAPYSVDALDALPMIHMTIQNSVTITVTATVRKPVTIRADKTVNRLIQSSIDNRHPRWLMLNLYPERATNAADLSAYDPALSAANCAAIESVLTQYRVSEVLGAWGQLRHKTLRRVKKDVLDLLERLGVELFTLDGLTASNDPRHPMPRGNPCSDGRQALPQVD
ncbi:DUF1643 domain-containing protein [Agromyces seonyuensis]|uniref:DUF1643 domain-containing protein n=1 Tax=Agromyces seonyuensis TaxID=2662446 RepID=A0A6I4P6W3_9MICO|nr:DUF1643 domain-containing protein [Agromyces seonyuensis]MWB99437.1 DUF1643 domain-containing protein [Agromyces seonyuensis]